MLGTDTQRDYWKQPQSSETINLSQCFQDLSILKTILCTHCNLNHIQ